MHFPSKAPAAKLYTVEVSYPNTRWDQGVFG